MSANHFNAQVFLKSLTSHPGVYQMFNAEGNVLYVGKARDLKKRLASYFRQTGLSSKTASLVKQIHKIDVIITHTENEALLLENNLIKKYRPRYNILLRDDKSYPYIFISDHPDYPRLSYHRGTKQATGRYFGPYPSAGIVHDSLKFLHKNFRLRSCEDSYYQGRTRPCLQYQIKRCSAPCVRYIEPDAYQQDVKNVELFLEGKGQAVIDNLQERMDSAASEMQFEEAAKIRDQIANLRRIQQQQYIMNRKGEVDIIAAVYQQGVACVQVLFVRGGQMLGSKVFFPKTPAEASIEELLSAFLPQFYLHAIHEQHLPEKILINTDFEERVWLADALSTQAKQKIEISAHIRGDHIRWMAMAVQTAQQALTSHLAAKSNYKQRLLAVQHYAELANLPRRMECFDVSHTMGEATVVSCVVFDNNGPLKTDYRRFNITGITPGDDYAAMRQALQRRYARLQKEEAKLPDILFIDGGKGQLRQAEEVLQELQISGIKLIGVAKGVDRKPGFETLFMAGQETPKNLPSDSPALHLIQQIRDEAHRFAITGHRARRAKARQQSSLEKIPGIGASKRRLLLKHFGGIQELMRASMEDLAKVKGVGKELAERIYLALHGS